MVKNFSLLFAFVFLSCVFNNNVAVALQDEEEYTEILPNQSSKTIHYKKTKKLQKTDDAETLFSIKDVAKDAKNVVKDTVKKVGNTAKKGADKIKTGVQKVFTMSVDFAKKVPWTVVFKEGLKVAVPALKGCVKGGVVAAIPALMAGPETLGLGTVGTLAGACAIGGAKSSVPAILNVTLNVFNSWSDKKKADEIQKQINLNQQDSNAVNATISQAKTVKSSLKTKDEKEAVDVAISKAQNTKLIIDNFVGQLKAEQKKYK